MRGVRCKRLRGDWLRARGTPVPLTQRFKNGQLKSPSMWRFLKRAYGWHRQRLAHKEATPVVRTRSVWGYGRNGTFRRLYRFVDKGTSRLLELLLKHRPAREGARLGDIVIVNRRETHILSMAYDLCRRTETA